MRINANYLNKDRTYYFQPGFDTKKFYQRVIVPNDNFKVRLVNMFNLNSDVIKPSGFDIEFEGFKQRVEIDWGDDNKYFSKVLEVIDSGFYNSNNGKIIEHIFKKAGTYDIVIESVEDLIVIDYDFPYNSEYFKEYGNTCERIMLKTIGIGGKINFYVPPKLEWLNKFETKIDTEVDYSFNNIGNNISLDSFRYKNRGMGVDLPTTWNLTVQNLQGLLSEITFKYPVGSELNCFFAKWRSRSDIILNDDIHLSNTLYNLFKDKKYNLELMGFFGHTKGFYNVTNGANLSKVIKDYIFDVDDYIDRSDILFNNLKFIMWDMYTLETDGEYWNTFNEDLKYLDANYILKRHPSYLKGAFGLMDPKPYKKAFNFGMLKLRTDNGEIDTEPLISSIKDNVQYNLDLSYFLFGSGHIVGTVDMNKMNIFDENLNTIKLNYKRMFSLSNNIDIKNKELIKNNYVDKEINNITLLPIPSIINTLTGKVQNIEIINKELFVFINELNSIVHMDKSYLDYNSDIRYAIFNDSFIIDNSNSIESECIYNISHENLFRNISNKIDFNIYVDDNIKTVDLYLSSNNKIDCTQTNPVMIVEDYMGFFKNDKKFVLNNKLDIENIRLFFNIDINITKTLNYQIRYDEIFMNNILTYRDNVSNNVNILHKVGDAFLEEIKEEYLDNSYGADSKYTGNIHINKGFYNCDYESKERLSNFMISKRDYTTPKEVIIDGDIKSGIIKKRVHYSDWNNYKCMKISGAQSLFDTESSYLSIQANNITDINLRDRSKVLENKERFIETSGNSSFMVLNERVFNKYNFEDSADLTRMFANCIGLDIQYNLPFNNRMNLSVNKLNLTSLFQIDISFKEDFDNNFNLSEFRKWNSVDDPNNIGIKIGAKHSFLFDHMRILDLNDIEIKKNDLYGTLKSLKIENMFKGRIGIMSFIKSCLLFIDNYSVSYKYFFDKEYDFGTHIPRVNSKIPVLIAEQIDKFLGFDFIFNRVTEENKKYIGIDYTPGYFYGVINVEEGEGIDYLINSSTKLNFNLANPIHYMTDVNSSGDSYFANSPLYIDYARKYLVDKKIIYLFEFEKVIKTDNITLDSDPHYAYGIFDLNFFFDIDKLLGDNWYGDIITEYRVYMSQHDSTAKVSCNFNLQNFNTNKNKVLISSLSGGIMTDFFEQFERAINNDSINKDMGILFNLGQNIYYINSYCLIMFCEFIMYKINNNKEFFNNRKLDFNIDFNSKFIPHSDALNLLYREEFMNSDVNIEVKYRLGDSDKNTLVIRDNDFQHTSLFKDISGIEVGKNVRGFIGNGIFGFDYLSEFNARYSKTLNITECFKNVYLEKLELITGSLYNPFGDSYYKNINFNKSNYKYEIMNINNFMLLNNGDTFNDNDIYLDSRFMNLISNMNSHLNILTSIKMENSFDGFYCKNRRFFGNIISNNVFTKFCNMFTREKESTRYETPNNLDAFYNKNLELCYLVENEDEVVEYKNILPSVKRIEGLSVDRIELNLIVVVNNKESENGIVSIYNIFNNNFKEDEKCEYASFTLLKVNGNEMDVIKKTIYIDKYIGLFEIAKGTYNVGEIYTWTYYKRLGITSKEFSSLSSLEIQKYQDVNGIQKRENQESFYTSRNFFSDEYYNSFLSGTTFDYGDPLRYANNYGSGYGTTLDKIKLNKSKAFTITGSPVVYRPFQSMGLASVDNTLVDINEKLISIMFKNMVRIPFDFFMPNINKNNTSSESRIKPIIMDHTSQILTGEKYSDYEKFHPSVTITDNNFKTYRFLKLIFKRKDDIPKDRDWNINFIKSELTRDIDNVTLTNYRKFQGKLIITESLEDLKATFEPLYFVNNSYSFTVDKDRDFITLYTVIDTPFSCYNSDGEVVSIEGDLGFNLNSYIPKITNENNEVDLSILLREITNGNNIKYIDDRLFLRDESEIGDGDITITFNNFEFRKFNFAMLENFKCKGTLTLKDSFNSKSNSMSIYGEISKDVNKLKIDNCFNTIINEYGISSKEPFKYLNLVSITNSFDLEDSSINKIIPSGFLETYLTSNFTISNSFRNVTILDKLKFSNTNGNTIMEINFDSSFVNSIAQPLVETYNENVLDYLFSNRFRKIISINYIGWKSLYDIQLELEQLKRTVEENVYNTEDELGLENNYVHKTMTILTE